MDTQTLIMTAFIAVLGLALAFMFLSDDIKNSIFKRKTAEKDKNANANLTKALKKFTVIKGFELLGKTTLVFEETSYTFDAILLGYFGTIGIKSVDLQGAIYGETNGNVWVQILESSRKEIPNPLKGLNGSVKFFKDLYKAEKVKCGAADSFVVFTAKKSELYIGKNSPAVSVSKLYSKLDTTKYLTDNGSDIEAMKKALAKYTTA